MTRTKLSASLVVTLAVVLFAAGLLLPAVPAAAGASRFEQQEEAQGTDSPSDAAAAPAPSWGERVVEAVLEMLADLIHGPGRPNQDPDGGEQGASIDPSGYRLSKN